MTRKLAALLLLGCLACSQPATQSSPTVSPSETSPTVTTPPPPTLPAGVPPEAQKATVAKHVDGDTIWAEGGTLPPAAASTIRILEIDTPETVKPGSSVECYGPEASAFTKADLPVGATIYLLADKEDKDRFGRFLRYIWRDNGEFFNEKIVRQGFAKSALYMPNDRFIGQIRAAEAEAKAVKRGLWGACNAPAPAPAPAPPAPAPAPVPAPAPPPPPPAGNCDASYPDFCIAPAPPNLNCSDIPQKRFTVRPPDPHGFDRNKDGVGCES